MKIRRAFLASIPQTLAFTTLTIFLGSGMGMLPAHAALRIWTNTLGGSWFAAANWSPNGVPGSSDAVTITNDGTYTVLVQTGTVSSAVINLGGGSGTQTLIYGTSSGQLFITNSTVRLNGVLVVTNGGLQGALLVEPGGQLLFDAPSGLFLYNFALTNQGIVTWTNGALAVGGSNSDTTSISNGGLWQMAGDNNINYGGGSRPVLLNGGTVRKLAGTGTSYVGMDLINLPSGLVDVLSGTLRFSAFATNVLGGSFTATAPGQMLFVGNQTDAGGAASGSGTIQFIGGTFYLRTNTIPQLKLADGDVYVASTTFQQAGAITNLTLEGAQLRGSNVVAGLLTVNAGNLLDNLTVQPGGQLLLGAPGGSLLYSLNLINLGTVIWSGNSLAVGGTPPTIISNGGTWTMTGDASLNFGGGITPCFFNSGTVQKTAGTGVSSLRDASFVNEASGVVRVDTGTLRMPDNYTNNAGTLRLNGGTLMATGTLRVTGGQLDGTGTIGADAVFDGGTISPGAGLGSGLMQFKSGLTLSSNSSLVIDGTGTIPNAQYDELSVPGALALSGCTLLVNSLPTVPVGTSLAIILHNGSPAAGTFDGLAENSLLTIGGQLFRIHYAGGGGSDVVLVRSSLSGPLLSSGGYTNDTFLLLGAGSASAIYKIQATTNFLQWTDVATAIADPAGNFSFTDTNATKFRNRFYRTAN